MGNTPNHVKKPSTTTQDTPINYTGRKLPLGWLLAAIAEHPVTSRWAFKGGTCLRKCWFETYRFSEDLDFTVASEDLEPTRLAQVFGEVADWLLDRCGLIIGVDSASFRRRQNKRGQPTIQGRISYNGPLASPSPPKVKLDLTADEVVVRPLERRPVFHPFTDADASGDEESIFAEALSYSLPELMGEKLRALAQRCRPRDLYDVVHMHRHPDLEGLDREVRDVLDAKCDHAGIETPTIESMRATVFRAEIEAEWDNMLGHQLPFLPPFEGFWSELDDVFAWLGGRTAPVLETVPVGRDIAAWRPARHMTTWRAGAPLEVIRFAGANRLKVLLDYRPERGRVGPRVVEPYSLRRTRDGKLLLFVRNDQGQLRSYRVDRIRGASIEPESFTPRYRVDF